MSTQAERLITASKIIPLKYMTYKHTINNYGESSIKSRDFVFDVVIEGYVLSRSRERRLLILILTSKIPVPNCMEIYLWSDFHSCFGNGKMLRLTSYT